VILPPLVFPALTVIIDKGRICKIPCLLRIDPASAAFPVFLRRQVLRWRREKESPWGRCQFVGESRGIV
jgi:hypothetical protein